MIENNLVSTITIYLCIIIIDDRSLAFAVINNYLWAFGLEYEFLRQCDEKDVFSYLNINLSTKLPCMVFKASVKGPRLFALTFHSILLHLGSLGLASTYHSFTTTYFQVPILCAKGSLSSDNAEAISASVKEPWFLFACIPFLLVHFWGCLRSVLGSKTQLCLRGPPREVSIALERCWNHALISLHLTTVFSLF